jgi:hypothetical protein
MCEVSMSDPARGSGPAKPGLQPVCFVLMPYGTKDAPVLGKVHFDDVYAKIIAPAIAEAGLQCIRADEELVGGFIHKPMYERLLLCDYAVADLSMANANVYYELGIRHATRPWSTVLLLGEKFSLPFDVAPLRALPYRLKGGRPHPDHVDADRAALATRLREARTRDTDSPLFQTLTTLAPPDMSGLGFQLFREQVEAVTALQKRLGAARQSGDLDAMHAVRAELGDLDDTEAGLAIDLLESYLAVEAWGAAVDLVARMPAILRRTPQIREKHAFALNRHGRRDDAEEILLGLIAERGPDSETYGLLGRVYKDQWQEALKQGRTRPAEVLLDKAIDAYLAGFGADCRDHYPGINAVQLMHLRDPTDTRIAEILPVVRFSARQKELRHHADFWDHATLLELAVIDENADDAWTAVTHAIYARPMAWQARSTLDTLVRLREARERTRPSPQWLLEIEAELDRVANPASRS